MCWSAIDRGTSSLPLETTPGISPQSVRRRADSQAGAMDRARKELPKIRDEFREGMFGTVFS